MTRLFHSPSETVGRRQWYLVNVDLGWFEMGGKGPPSLSPPPLVVPASWNLPTVKKSHVPEVLIVHYEDTSACDVIVS